MNLQMLLIALLISVVIAMLILIYIKMIKNNNKNNKHTIIRIQKQINLLQIVLMSKVGPSPS